MCKPRRIFIERLLNNSLERDLEKAMTEWVIVGEIGNNQLNFKWNCDLCGAAIYETNYVIYNVKTKKEIHIGRDCVKRFSSNYKYYKNTRPVYMEKLRREYKLNQMKLELKDRYHLICNQGIPNELQFNIFRNKLLDVLKSQKALSLLETRDGAIKVLIKFLDKPNYTEAEVSRLKLMLNEPNKARRIFVKNPRRKQKRVDKYGILID